MLTLINGVELIFDVEKYDVVLVGTSILGMLSNGFQNKIRNKYPIVHEVNKNQPFNDLRRLGTCVDVVIEDDDKAPLISLLYITRLPSSTKLRLSYDALESCLKRANEKFKGKKVATTILGSTIFDGNGDPEKCLRIIEENTSDLELYVYNYAQRSRKEEIERQNKYIEKVMLTDKEKGQFLFDNKKELLKKLYIIS